MGTNPQRRANAELVYKSQPGADARMPKTTDESTHDTTRALCAWPWSGTPSVHINRDGLINQTFVVITNNVPTAVLQRLNTSIFSPSVHEDIEAITTHLAAAKLPTPRLLRTIDGCLWHTLDDGSVWRCLSYEGDRTVHKVESHHHAWEAAYLVARFHAALHNLEWDFRSVRVGVHDTQKHVEALVLANDTHRHHRLHDDVSRVTDGVLTQWTQWDGPRDLPPRVIHGDLKISNIRFLGTHAHCLVDLDTTARSTFDVDLGDALRSWCNSASENATEATFDPVAFAAAALGYHQGVATFQSDTDRGAEVAPSTEEWDSVVPGVERITLELAARFARDALEERYFGWDPRVGSRGDHNLLRARGQLALAQSIHSSAAKAERILATVRQMFRS